VHYIRIKRHIPLLHRNGRNYLINPESERLRPVTAESFPRFGPYK
jgi:hypothetical protein